MKILIDRDKCVCAGQCAQIAPAVFSQDERDGVVILLTETPPAEEHAAVRAAVGLCPAGVIKIAA